MHFSSQESHFLSFLEIGYNMLFSPLLPQSKISIRIYYFVLWNVFLSTEEMCGHEEEPAYTCEGIDPPDSPIATETK